MAGTPATVNAIPTPAPPTGNLVADVESLFLSLGSNPAVATFGQAFISSIESDALSFALASPSAVLADIPGLLSALNPILASESYYPTLTAAEAIIASDLTSIVSADATNTAKLASDVVNFLGEVAANPTIEALGAALGSSIETDAINFALASPSAVLSDLALIVSDINPIVATESYAPFLSTLETQVLSQLSVIVSADSPKATGRVMTTTTSGLNMTGLATGSVTMPSQTIAPFKGAAGHLGVTAMSVVAAAGLCAMALL
ncbi:hypothetical protein MMC19_002516 [Ptychographa xylographoides]|nr:hypothetical protein [Ptychographa xylographoides]